MLAAIAYMPLAPASVAAITASTGRSAFRAGWPTRRNTAMTTEATTAFTSRIVVMVMITLCSPPFATSTRAVPKPERGHPRHDQRARRLSAAPLG